MVTIRHSLSLYLGPEARVIGLLLAMQAVRPVMAHCHARFIMSLAMPGIPHNSGVFRII